MTIEIRQTIITSYSERRVPDPRGGQMPTDMTITARCASGTLTIPAASAPEDLMYQTAAWRYAEHERAARALLERMGWQDHDLVGGSLPDGGYTFVQVPRR